MGGDWGTRLDTDKQTESIQSCVIQLENAPVHFGATCIEHMKQVDILSN